jgi:hypothetical protein
VTACREALMARKKLADPLLMAASHNNLGLALLMYGGHARIAKRVAAAVKTFDDSLNIYLSHNLTARAKVVDGNKAQVQKLLESLQGAATKEAEAGAAKKESNWGD